MKTLKGFFWIVVAVCTAMALNVAYKPATTSTHHVAKRQMTDAEVEANWNALWGAASSGFKRGFVEGYTD